MSETYKTQYSSEKLEVIEERQKKVIEKLEPEEWKLN
jgi:hypothetical protein